MLSPGRARSGNIAIRLAALGVLALPAWAQAAGQHRQSMLDIFLAGIELPSYLIIAGSLIVCALVVEHFITVRRVTIAPPEQVLRARRQIEARSFRECVESLQKSQSFFARVMSAALAHARHGFDAMHEAALEKSGELSGRLFRKAEYLNIIGNLGPLLGLLGTVLGMIKAFGDLGGGASGGKLAEGISEALVNTFLGLAVAIVGIGFFGACRNRIDSLTVEATVDALDLLEYFRPASGATVTAAMPSVTDAARRPAAASADAPRTAPPSASQRPGGVTPTATASTTS